VHRKANELKSPTERMGCASRPAGGFPALNGELPPDDVIFGGSSAGEAVRLSAEMAATTQVPVLLQGQSGTGKEILAKYIHRRSSWGNGAFVKVNCPAIPGTLLESELFGYQRGAFTGAYSSKPGRVELAHRGTLFLDEIAELAPGLQAKLLQLLQDGQFCRIGAQEDRQVEVRVVCATNRQLDKEIKAGTFRQDLFYRINVLTIELPPLQQRRSDIPVLVNFLLEINGKILNRPVKPLSDRSLRSLQNHDWPGNIRELETVIKRYVLSGSESVISKSLWNSDPGELVTEIPFNEKMNLKDVTRRAVKRLEEKIILKTLQVHGWNRRTTARELGISYAALLYKLREAGIPPRATGIAKRAAPSASRLGLASDAQANPGPQQSELPV
jgi:two-component system, NtrC family, response regulator AtoC